MRGILPVALLLAACSTQASPGVPTPTPTPTATATSAPAADGVTVTPAPPAATPTPPPMPSIAPGTGVRPFDLPQGATLRFDAATPGLVVVGAAGSTEGVHTFSLAGTRGVQQAATPAVGGTVQFWVNTGDFTDAGDSPRTCVLKQLTPRLEVYLDQAARPAAAQGLAALAKVFEDPIISRDEAAFGGLPGGGRITLVVSPAVDNFGKLKGHEGYFWARDLIDGQAHGAQRRVLFVSDDYVSYPDVVVDGVLAHEYQHLLNYVRKAAAAGRTLSEESWLDEGLSVYAQQVAGYGLTGGDRFVALDVADFERRPTEAGLLEWSASHSTLSFGQSYLFVHFLVDRYGEAVLRKLVDNPQVGVANVETVTGAPFAELFRDWTVANYTNHYQGLDLAANYGGYQLPGFLPATSPATGALRPWSALAFRVGQGPVVLTGSATSRLVGAFTP
ncbi:MAG: hypothetical protein JWM80_5148 [Cyanobacteria bacterium RYN_339]|nr:hypothetical protein [Cyanobacteria bacterium RYN_339]